MSALPPAPPTIAAGRNALLPALLLLASLAAAPVHAEGDPDAVRGLVVERCARCHRVPGAPEPRVEGLTPPAFADIARDRQTYTDARLRAFLQRPHWPMQAFILSPRDIENLLAYFRTLRER